MDPAAQTPMYIIINGVGERAFTYPTDIDWTQTSCSYTPPVYPTAPTTLPATPTVAAANAKFIYNSSGAYTNAATLDVTDGNQWGGSLTESTYAVSGQNLICLTPTTLSAGAGNYYHGGVLSGVLDVSALKYLHVDAWVPGSTDWSDFAIAPISTGNPSKNGQPLQSIFSTSSVGSWASFDIPLTTLDATGLIDLTKIDQFIFKNSGNSSVADLANNKIYLDNIYFWTDVVSTITVSPTTLSVAAASNSNTATITTSLGWTATSDQSWLTLSAASGTGNASLTLNVAANSSFDTRTAVVTVTASDNTVKTITVTQAGATPSAAATPTMAAANVISVYSDPYTSLATSWDNWYGSTITGTTLESNPTLKVNSSCCFGTNLSGAPVDISAMTKFHLDVFPIGTTTITVGIVDANGQEAKLPLTLTSGQWNSIDLLLSDLKANNTSIDLTKIKQLGFWSVSGTFYMDNALFYTGTYSSSTSGIKNDKNTALNLNTLVKENLVVNASKSIQNVTIFNLQGQVVKNSALNSSNASLNVSNLAAGAYYVVVKYQDGTTSSSKVIKK